MKITEARLRQILREESHRVRLFESDAGADNGNQIAFVDQNLKTSNTKLWNVEMDLEKAVRVVFYGGTGTWNAIKDFANFRVDAGMFYKDLSWGEGGDFADLETADRQEIVKKTYDAIKANKLTAESFYEDVKTQFLSNPNTQNDPDLPEKASANTREGTDDYAEKLIGIQTTYHDSLKKMGLAPAAGAAAGTQASSGAPAAAGQPAAKAGAKVVAEVQELQGMLGVNPQDGKWGPATQAALEPFLTDLLNKGNVEAGGTVYQKGVDMSPFTKGWAKISKLITKVNNAAPVPPSGWSQGGFPPTVSGILSFIKQLQAPTSSVRTSTGPGVGAATPPTPIPEGSWRRGTRVNESERRIRIAWGR